MITNEFAHLSTYEKASRLKFSANENNTSYVTLQNNGRTVSVAASGTPDVSYQTICFIPDVQKIVTHGQVYDCKDTVSEEGTGQPSAGTEFVFVNSLPAAGSSTMNRLYIVTDSTATKSPYTRKYITVQHNGTYIWDEFTVSEEYIKSFIPDTVQPEKPSHSSSKLVGSEISQTGFVCPVTLEDNTIHTVLCINNTDAEQTLTFSSSYMLPTGKENKLTVKPNTYGEISFMQIDGTIYVRYL